MASRVLPLCRRLPARARGLVPPSAAAGAIQRRYLNIHEYQAQKIFEDFGVGVPKNIPAFSAKEAAEVAAQLPGDEVVIKAQVLAGGRGLGYFKENNFQGGVHIIKKTAVEETANKMLGMTLITKQTGEAGKPNNTVLLAEKVSIATEKYFAILMDRGSGGPLMIGSKTGGTSIEDIAEKYPSAIIKMPVDIMAGITPDQAMKMATEMGFGTKEAADLIANLYKVFIERDCTMLEINPLAQLSDGRVLVCDSKVGFDDNAEFRQKDIHAMRDLSQENPLEVKAKEADLNYIKLDGSIACMVNGAGLAMSTMDLLSSLGGSPANFLDVGGSATVENMTVAFNIVMSDPNVKAIFVNIFGGIARCDHIAEAVCAGVKAVGGNEALKAKPLVVRFEGTNVEKGMEIMKASGVNCFLTNEFTAAAKEAVKLAAA
jgi:succinyl-CoA synthetase beta subunit